MDSLTRPGKLTEKALRTILLCVGDNPRTIKRFVNGLILALEIDARTGGASLDPVLLAKIETIRLFRRKLFQFLRRSPSQFLELQTHAQEASTYGDLVERIEKDEPLSEATLLIEGEWFDLIREGTAFDHDSLGLALSRAPQAEEDPLDEESEEGSPLPSIGSSVQVDMPGPGDSVLPLSVDRYLVTNQQYHTFLTDVAEGETGLEAPAYWTGGRVPEGLEEHPVTGVSATDAERFARTLGRRLLRDDEWMFLASGGGGSRPYPWGEQPSAENGNFFESRHGTTTPVTAHPSGMSKHGLFDLAGNVWEWTATAAHVGGRVLRGGSYLNSVKTSTIDTQLQRPPTRGDAMIGFRTCQDIV